MDGPTLDVALRDLHKPTVSVWWGKPTTCSHCRDRHGDHAVPFPCPTIPLLKAD